MKCLQHGPEACVDRKILVEASEGLEKAQVTFLTSLVALHSSYQDLSSSDSFPR